VKNAPMKNYSGITEIRIPGEKYTKLMDAADSVNFVMVAWIVQVNVA
jgi:hypothetical protein